MRGTRGMRMLVVGAVSLGLVASACGEDRPALEAEGPGEEQGTISIGGEEANNHGTEDLTGRDELELELDDFYFEPTVVEGQADQAITLRLHNEGEAPHTFTIHEANVDEELQPGDEDVTVDVAFPSSGALVFVCRFHRAQGMLGALSVGGSLETGGGDDPGSGGGYG